MVAKTNQITGAAALGSQVVSDPGFQPSALFLWFGRQTANGASSDTQFGLSFSTDAQGSVITYYNSNDAVTTSDTVVGHGFPEAMLSTNAGSATLNANVATVSAINGDGFTLDWDVLGLPSSLVNYLAIGGVTAKVGTASARTTTGNQSVTGLGFEPDIVFFQVSNLSANSTINNSGANSIGVMTPAGQWAVGVKAVNAQATSDTARGFSNAHCMYRLSSSAATDTVVFSAAYVSMDADGFTFNVDATAGSSYLINYLVIKGGSWAVGTDTQKATTGTEATTGIGFEPEGVILASVCDTQTAGTATNSRLSLGATTGVNNNVAVWAGDRDNSADTISNTVMSNSKCIVMATEGTSATPTINAEAALSSFDADGFTLDWTTADATERVFGYVAFGSDAVSDSNGRGSLLIRGVG